MRKTVMVAAFIAAAAASPALAQGQSGNHGPPDGVGGGPPDFAGGAGGGPGGGAGAGPPMTPPGQTDDPLSAARAIAEQRGQFAQDFVTERRQSGIGNSSSANVTGQDRAAIQRERAAQYYANAQIRRQQAQQYAAAARAGTPLPRNASDTLRNELRADMESWRATFGVGRDEWQAARDQWLAERGTMSAQDWAQRRLDWFAFRDAWVAKNRAWAQARNDR
jgi:hypothetical protein